MTNSNAQEDIDQTIVDLDNIEKRLKDVKLFYQMTSIEKSCIASSVRAIEEIVSKWIL